MNNQSGFTSAALGFLVFGALMVFVVLNNKAKPPAEPESLSNPTISFESSTVPSGSISPSPLTSTIPSISVQTSASPSPSTSTSPAKNSNSPAQTASSPKGSYIKIIAPNGGETYTVGSTLKINWEYNDLAQCVIKYVMENGTESSLYIPVGASVKSFQLPLLASYLGPLDSAKLKIDISCTSADKAVAADRSDGYFTITK